jgi:hypothetical protein
MADVLDPDGDPLLDPDGDPLAEPTVDVVEPVTLATGHISLVAPFESFHPPTPIDHADYLDTFSRETINPTPDGYEYRNAHQWAIVDGALQPTVRRTKLLASVSQSFDVVMSVQRVDANISIFDRAQTAGLVLSYRDEENYTTVSMRNMSGDNVIEVVERTDGVDSHTGGWTISGHVGELGVHLIYNWLRVYWQGTELGSLYLGPARRGSVGLLGEQDPDTDIQPVRLDNWRISQPFLEPQHPLAIYLHGTDMVSAADVAIPLGPAIRGPVAYGPRVTQPGTYVPPIVAKVFRLRDWTNPIVTLDQSFARTWQEQLGEAGSGSVTLLNDDPDLALIRDGDVVRFELYGEAAFSFVVTGREKTTIAPGEEHDEVTVLTGPGLLSWLTSTMLIYPARQPPALVAGPVPDRYIQGDPIEDNRVFSWASYAELVDGDLYGPTVDIGPMTEPLPENWPPGVIATRIWVPGGDQAGSVYFRMGFNSAVPDCEIYIYTPLMDPVMAWLDGDLAYESEGGPDYGEVGNVSGALSDLGTDAHVLTIKVDHVGGPAWLAVVGIGVDEDGNFTGQVMGTADTWKAIAYPPTPPAVTAGAVIEAVLGEMNSRRYNPQMALMGTTEIDSDGNAWPPLPELTTKVGQTVWAFMQEIADHVEFHMAHNPNELYAWVAGHRGNVRNVTLHGPTDPHDPDSSNLRGLTHRRAT